MATDLVVQESFFHGTLASGDVEEQHFRGCEFSHVQFEGGIDSVFERCKFEACDFSNAVFSRANMIGSKFDSCVFSNTVFDEAQFIECDISDSPFANCPMYGIRIVDTSLSGGTLAGCDARYAVFESVWVKGTVFDDTDFSDANLSEMWELVDAQLALTNGNRRTILPEGILRPEDWYISSDEEEGEVQGASVAGIPGQAPAPLKVVWRNGRLVPDPRGSTDDWRNPSITVLFTSLKEDVSAFLEDSPTNHPVGRPIRALSAVLKSGLSGLNPVGVGYNVELIKAQIFSVEEELSPSTVGVIKAIVVGGELLASQFRDWQEVAANRDASTSDKNSLVQVADAVRVLASSMRITPDLFDRRIAEAVESQADDLASASGNAKLQVGVARSNGNIFSALATRSWAISKSTVNAASQEATKQLIALFFKSNEHAIRQLISWAPSALSWLKHFLQNAIS